MFLLVLHCGTLSEYADSAGPFIIVLISCDPSHSRCRSDKHSMLRGHPLHKDLYMGGAASFQTQLVYLTVGRKAATRVTLDLMSAKLYPASWDLAQCM
ncbi:hypothetical protein CEXT_567731 [Caerostris extrusa]|uniref:Uncharacterized protein n=1 Tax=Caerostris extrusa TaxID=172846 RepID=A0AAV4R356_CAEEX|nr:hypothetical protein CEXT_567731 [Caerostris extrusa]